MDYKKDAEDQLRYYKYLKGAVDNLKTEISNINTELTCIKNIDYSGMPHGSGSALPDDNIVNKLYRKQRAIEELKITLRAIKRIEVILDKIQELNESEGKILKVFYIEGLRGEALEDAMGCSERNCYRIKYEAIKKLAIELYGIKVLGE